MTYKGLLGAVSALALMSGVAVAQTAPSTGAVPPANTSETTQAQPPSPGTDAGTTAQGADMGAGTGADQGAIGTDTTTGTTAQGGADTTTDTTAQGGADMTTGTTAQGTDTTTTTGTTSTTMAADQMPAGEPVAASHLMNHDVTGADGDDLGTISDIVFDSSNGQIRQLVLRSGGVLGLGGRTVAIDFERFELVPNGGLRLAVTEDEFETMPDFDVDEMTVSLDDDGAGLLEPAAGTTDTAPVTGTTRPAQ
jgi:sporulation protein YlmC with PRC-barrel domain